MTVTEKIDLLLDWVSHNGGAEGALFRIETVRAQRAVIPLKSETSVNKLLSVWISLTEARTLYLAEDFHIGDLGTRGLSAGSAFRQILKQFSEVARDTGLSLQREVLKEPGTVISCPGLCSQLAEAKPPTEFQGGDFKSFADDVVRAVNDQIRILKSRLLDNFSDATKIVQLRPKPNLPELLRYTGAFRIHLNGPLF
jgi:hypothetical protein